MKPRREMELLWKKEKYLVMFHSQNHYQKIRETLKHDCTVRDIERLIEEAKKVEPAKGSVVNAYQHMWGYFKKQATEEERAAYMDNQQRYENGEADSAELIHFLRSLAEKYQKEYLLQSSILDVTEEQG